MKVWQVPDTTAHCLGWFWKGTFPFKATGMKRPHMPADQSMAETRVSHPPPLFWHHRLTDQIVMATR